MNTPKAKRLSVDLRTKQLLEVGMRLFSERAYDEVGIDAIAAYAGISKGLLYHYFAGKRGFYVATVREVAARVIAATAPDPALPPPAALRGSLQAFFLFIADNASLYRAMLRGGIGSDGEVHAIVEEVRQTSMQRLLALFAGEVPRPRLRTLLYGWVGLVEHVSLDWLAHRDLDAEEVVDLVLDALFRALPPHDGSDPVPQGARS